MRLDGKHTKGLRDSLVMNPLCESFECFTPIKSIFTLLPSDLTVFDYFALKIIDQKILLCKQEKVSEWNRNCVVCNMVGPGLVHKLKITITPLSYFKKILLSWAHILFIYWGKNCTKRFSSTVQMVVSSNFLHWQKIDSNRENMWICRTYAIHIILTRHDESEIVHWTIWWPTANSFRSVRTLICLLPRILSTCLPYVSTFNLWASLPCMMADACTYVLLYYKC